MQTIIETTVYKLDELEPHMRRRAIEKLAQANYSDYEIDTDFYEEDLAEYGCNSIVLLYNISYSQGDGAAFDCVLNLKTFVEKMPGFFDRWVAWKFAVEGHHYWTARINASNRGSHITGVDVEVGGVDPCGPFEDLDYDAWQELLENDREAVEQAILDWARSKAQEIYDEMVSELEYVQTEEYIGDQCAANEYLFNDHGDLI